MDLGKPNRFGPYEIVAPLGAGGMGEVYRARDTRLNRDVAPAVAALNHPDIVAIFDFGEEQGGWNLVSPDGKTTKALGKIATPHLMFSQDGKLLYGIRAERVKETLLSLDIATGTTQDIRDLGKEFAPASDLSPGIRYTLTPDGKSKNYAVESYKSDIWLLEGFRQPGWFGRMFR